MQQTPVHDIHNNDLLNVLPKTSLNLIEIGCSSGALAREFKKIKPDCHYIGSDIEPSYCELAKRYCDVVYDLNIDKTESDFFEAHKDRDCWIFGDTLEHLVDPWRVLREIRNIIPAHGVIAASIPNAQHWSVFAKLSIGDFRYVDSGLFDRTHLRWFTHATILELFSQTGFRVISIHPRIFDEPMREQYMPVIRLIGEMAKACGSDPNLAIQNSLAFQFVVLAIPA
jgi:SAM-dependent methyltransferase